MSDQKLEWRCDCGAVDFRVSRPKGTRCVCYCADCQAFLRHLGRDDLFEEASGTDLFQVMPDQVTLVAGGDHLGCLRLSDKGPLRWFTTCCATPVCNTGASRRLPLASFVVRRFSDPDATGEVIARVNRRAATGPIEGPKGNAGRLVRSFLIRALGRLLTGRYRKTPFLLASGAPLVPHLTLSDEDRERAYGG